MDKVVYQEAVRVGKRLAHDAEEALTRLMKISNIDLADIERWGHAYSQVRELEDELWQHVQFVGHLFKAEGPEVLKQFGRDIGFEPDDDG